MRLALYFASMNLTQSMPFSPCRKLTMFSLNMNQSVDYGLTPPNVQVMKFDKDADIFVGGLPEGKRLPGQVTSKTFHGCIETLALDKQLIGLWNWKVLTTNKISTLSVLLIASFSRPQNSKCRRIECVSVMMTKH